VIRSAKRAAVYESIPPTTYLTEYRHAGEWGHDLARIILLVFFRDKNVFVKARTNLSSEASKLENPRIVLLGECYNANRDLAGVLGMKRWLWESGEFHIYEPSDRCKFTAPKYSYNTPGDGAFLCGARDRRR
jgi:hypothetical protein